MRLGLLCGSLNLGSSNQAALDVVAKRAEGDGDVVTYSIGGLGEIPAFRQDQVDDAPEPVARFRSEINRMDGLAIAAPEYAAGLSGSTKNALDWLVGASTLYQKPVAVLSVGTTGGERALEQLVHTLSWQGAWTVAALGIAMPRTKMIDGAFTDQATIGELALFADTLVLSVRGSGRDRLTALDAVVGRYGIDVERFGEIT